MRSLVLLLWLSVAVFASPVQIGGDWTFNLGSLSALATFEKDASNLIITLQNTATNATANPEVLQSFYFTIQRETSPGVWSDSTGAFSRISAIGGGFWNCATCAATNLAHSAPANDVGTNWVYNTNPNGDPGVNDHGLSSAGYGLPGWNTFHSDYTLPGENNPPNGPPFGIVPITQSSLFPSGNPKVFVLDHVTFTLGGLLPDSNYRITQTWFQYGTSLGSEPGGGGHQNEVPEPSQFLGVAAIGGLGLLTRWMRRRRTNSTA